MLDTAHAAIEFFPFASQPECFFFAEALKAALITHGFKLKQALDRLLDGLEVGHHAARPAAIDERHAALIGEGLDRVARRALGANKQNAAIFCRDLAAIVGSIMESRQAGLQIEDMDVVALTVNVRRHAR